MSKFLRYPGALHNSFRAGERTTHRGQIACGMLAYACICLLCAPAAFGAAELQFDPPTGSFACSTSPLYTIDVVINEEITDFQGFSLVFQFTLNAPGEPIITPFAVEPGELLTAAHPDPDCDGYFFHWLNSAAVGDSIVVDGALRGCSVSGPGSIVRLVFAGEYSGTSTLTCHPSAGFDSLLRDGQNQPIDFDCLEATVTYLCPVSTAQNRWGEFKARYR